MNGHEWGKGIKSEVAHTMGGKKYRVKDETD